MRSRRSRKRESISGSPTTFRLMRCDSRSEGRSFSTVANGTIHGRADHLEAGARLDRSVVAVHSAAASRRR
jgi:hypothetical protein